MPDVSGSHAYYPPIHTAHSIHIRYIHTICTHTRPPPHVDIPVHAPCRQTRTYTIGNAYRSVALIAVSHFCEESGMNR